jgi:hypothetical protein
MLNLIFIRFGQMETLIPYQFSKLYFCNKAGDKVWELPYDMEDDFQKPVLLNSKMKQP